MLTRLAYSYSSMKREEIIKQLRELRTESDPKYREALTEVANSLEDLLVGAAKGGRTRASKLSKKRRSEIARKAANARWGQSNGSKKSKPKNR